MHGKVKIRPKNIISPSTFILKITDNHVYLSHLLLSYLFNDVQLNYMPMIFLIPTFYNEKKDFFGVNSTSLVLWLKTYLKMSSCYSVVVVYTMLGCQYYVYNTTMECGSHSERAPSTHDCPWLIVQPLDYLNTHVSF